MVCGQLLQYSEAPARLNQTNFTGGVGWDRSCREGRRAPREIHEWKPDPGFLAHLPRSFEQFSGVLMDKLGSRLNLQQFQYTLHLFFKILSDFNLSSRRRMAMVAAGYSMPPAN